MGGELYSDKSDRPGYSYLAWHCSYYNRYAEKGHDAPKGVHPNFIFKTNKSRVNHTQQVPHASKEVEDNPEEVAILVEMIHLITIIIKWFLPEDYVEMQIYISRLPLNECSLAYPFGRFVVNIGVTTRGHRDCFDKKFCVIIPAGCWTGGELCLFETGFVFCLHPWDILIFSSCNVTHFNLHYEGVRTSIVLHSDKYGDQWVRDGNGWLPNDNEYDSGDEDNV
ncbi:hypothetical protein B0H17DRAFT_956712 [Mycena rosella]|uniref:Uncharacterized protein n=1 Tax=Mycena rosella TaxID=1033263 RepID=A0AAD7CNM6_MYCRO|nr:hypothetical protein B0H17DRAFT_956712 [Mycena rosella]